MIPTAPGTPRLTIRLFGYPYIQVDHAPVRVERRKTLALAAYLAVETPPLQRGAPGRSVPCPGVGRETLSALLWPDASPDQAGAALRQALWDFGKSAGEQWLTRNTRIVNPERSYLNRHILGEASQKMGALARAREYFEANLAYSIHIGDTAIQAYYRKRLESLA